MHDLLPYYERELTFLRQRSREFAEQYPKIAKRLLLSGETCDDPHIGRLIEAFALLTARVQKKLDDDFPDLTESLLDVLYPHYLRPFPSCSIARFDAAGAQAQLSAPALVRRGTLLTTRPVKGLPCKFRTAYDVHIAPIDVADVRFDDTLPSVRGYRPPGSAAAALSISLVALSEQLPLERIDLERLRLFVDGEASMVSQIREALFVRRVAIACETQPGAPWLALPDALLQPVGFADDEGLLDYDARSHLAYRLLSEFFAFPEKFNFIDIDYRRLRAQLPAGTRRVTLKFLLAAAQGNDEAARLLERVGRSNFRLGCTPVVNLFRQHADPIRLTHAKVGYPLVADARRPYAFELYAVESVKKVERTAQGETVVGYRPFYALRHGESITAAGHFWHLHRDESVAQASPGYEYEISVVDADFDPVADKTETLSIELTCTNRDLPAELPFGLDGGDLFIEGGSIARSIALLRRPTPSYRVQRGRGSHWRLISHLALNHLSLTEEGLGALKEMLALYNVTGSLPNQRQIDGLAAIAHRPVTASMSGNPFPTFVKGIEIELTLDEQSYVGTGIYLFARVLDHFFSLYVHANSFTRLIVRSAKSGETLLQCPPRNGELTLV